MPVHRRKDTTPHLPDSTQEQRAPALPEQQAFQQYVRELARAGLRMVLEGVMREELDALIGAAWRESSPSRKGYRNGSYTREPFDHFWSDRRPEGATRPRGPVPHPGRMTRYRRYEPQVAQGLTKMFVAGVSTRHPWGKWLKP